MKRSVWWILGGAASVLLLALAGWRQLRAGREEAIFTVAPTTRQDLRETITSVGEVQTRTKVNVGTSVTAEIKEIHVKDGQWVKAGDLLVTLDQERYRQELNRASLSLDMARQDLEKADATWKKLERSFQRADALFREGLVSSEDHQAARLSRDSAQADLRRARTAVQQAQAGVALSQDALDKTVIRAPMAGRVTGLKAEKGETAIAGQTNIAGAVLMVISQMDELLAEVKVGELEVVKLRPGLPAEIQVDALPGRTFAGKVLDVATSVDRGQGASLSMGAETRNYRVRVILEGLPQEQAGLRPGMSARISILANEAKGVLTVPLQAVQERETRQGGLGLIPSTRLSVFVVKDGVAQERVLRTGVGTRSAVQVLEGVTEGETVITGPVKALTTLLPGTKVRTLSEAQALRERFR